MRKVNGFKGEQYYVAYHPLIARYMMEKSTHRFHELFAQLGLPSDEHGIAQFLQTHTPLANHIKLPDAPFWSPAQAAFLHDALLQDSDWAELADQLSQAMRG
jgi:hypothetical protein